MSRSCSQSLVTATVSIDVSLKLLPDKKIMTTGEGHTIQTIHSLGKIHLEVEKDLEMESGV